MKLKRDHGYKQQKRLKHERAINKYTSNLQEKNTTTNFIIVIYYITKNLQINLILQASSPQRESLREDNQMFSKVLKVGCVHGLSYAAFTSCPRNPYYVQSFFFFIFSGSSFYAQNLSYKGMMLQFIASDKLKKLNRYSEVFNLWIQRHQSEFFEMNQSENCRKTSCFLRGQIRTNQRKAK